MIHDVWLDRLLSRTNMAYWWPLVEQSGVPVPRTKSLKAEIDWSPMWDGKKPDGYDAFIDQTIEAMREFDLPLFLRTGFTSGKHDWADTCCVRSLEKETVMKHVDNIFVFSCMCDILGLPTVDWFVREMLPVSPAFFAFNHLPVTKERRYLFIEGMAKYHYPYWPPAAFTCGGSIDHSLELPCNWSDLLEELNSEPPEEVEMLAELTNQACSVDGLKQHEWSVDWLQTDRGWVLIDMAEASKSYVWEERKAVIA